MNQPAKSLQEVEEIVSKIEYKDWKFVVIGKHNDTILLQIVFMERDATRPDDETLYPQHCRKWYVSPYSTTSEVIRTCFKAAVAAEMHEAEERFMYKGVRVFDPHTDLVELTEFMATAKQDVRG